MTIPFLSCFPRVSGRAALVSLGSVALLSSCGDKEEPAVPAAPAEAAAEPAPAPEEAKSATPQEVAEAAREAVYRQLFEKISPLVTDRAAAPEFNEDVKVYLESLVAYYEALAALPPSAERVLVGHRVANLRQNLGAYARAVETYDQVQKDWDALPEAERQAVALRRVQSAIYGGKGLCLLRSNKVADAIPLYEKALETDLAILAQLGVAEGAALPEGSPEPDVSRAVADVLGSYRCLGECHRVAGDMEEARDIYKKGIERMTQWMHLDVNSPMAIAYVKLHAALGDLENRCGKEREALASWVQAANLCNAVFTNSRQLAVKAQAKRSFEALRPLILEKNRKLQGEAPKPEAPVAEAAAEVKPEPPAAPPVEEAAPAEAPAQPAVEEQKAPEAEAEKPKQERRSRNNRRQRGSRR